MGCGVPRVSRSRRVACPGAPSGGEFEGVGGDAGVQDALEQRLRLQIASEEIKESIKDDLRSKIEEARQISETLSAELDEGYRIERFRNELETQEALASAMEKFNELEDEIAAMKQQLQADRDELAAWEKSAAEARSRGLFFKTLYAPPPTDSPGDGGASGSGAGSGGPPARGLGGALDAATATAVAAAAARVRAPAEREVGSPLRLWLFAYMASVLALVVTQDVAGGAPAVGLDALYAVLAVVLGANAWNERQMLVSRRQGGGAGGGRDGGGGGERQ